MASSLNNSITFSDLNSISLNASSHDMSVDVKSEEEDLKHQVDRWVATGGKLKRPRSSSEEVAIGSPAPSRRRLSAAGDLPSRASGQRSHSKRSHNKYDTSGGTQGQCKSSSDFRSLAIARWLAEDHHIRNDAGTCATSLRSGNNFGATGFAAAQASHTDDPSLAGCGAWADGQVKTRYDQTPSSAVEQMAGLIEKMEISNDEQRRRRQRHKNSKGKVQH